VIGGTLTTAKEAASAMANVQAVARPRRSFASRLSSRARPRLARGRRITRIEEDGLLGEGEPPARARGLAR
jgi:hypothetical protein